MRTGPQQGVLSIYEARFDRRRSRNVMEPLRTPKKQNKQSKIKEFGVPPRSPLGPPIGPFKGTSPIGTPPSYHRQGGVWLSL